jgi:hypothetical protein
MILKQKTEQQEIENLKTTISIQKQEIEELKEQLRLLNYVREYDC